MAPRRDRVGQRHAERGLKRASRYRYAPHARFAMAQFANYPAHRPRENIVSMNSVHT